MTDLDEMNRLTELVRWLALAAALVAAVLLAREWRAARADALQLKATLAAQEKLVAEAESRERARDAALHETLSQIAARKRAVNTPAQIVRELPRDIPLPAPLLLSRPPESLESKDTGPAKDARTKANPDATPAPIRAGLAGADAAQEGAVIPPEDLKPLFDFVQDCKACRAQLSTREADLADERAKNEALARERDAAVRAAKGGGFWRRVRHAAKWFAIGAVAGAAAVAASR